MERIKFEGYGVNSVVATRSGNILDSLVAVESLCGLLVPPTGPWVGNYFSNLEFLNVESPRIVCADLKQNCDDVMTQHFVEI